MNKEKIISHFGISFYEKVEKALETYGALWKLSQFEQIDYYSINCIFACESEELGPCILKIGTPCKETRTEYQMLSEYQGSVFCQVYHEDLEEGILLLERLSPGIMLRQEKNLDTRLHVFSDMFQGLHRDAKEGNVYPTYMGWVSRITQYMKASDKYPELTTYMIEAEQICQKMWEKYSQRLLLHGDMHHDNILLGENGKYRLIDPKGVIGDPIFDIPRFMLNEFDEIIDDTMYEKICYIVTTLSEKLGYPREDIADLLFMETALSECWSAESEQEVNMEYVKFAHRVMCGR